MSEKDFYASDKELTSTFETQNILIMETLQLYYINNYIDTSQFNNKLFVSQMNEKYMNSFFHIFIDYYETPLFDYYDTAILHIHENFFHKIENFHYNIASDNNVIEASIKLLYYYIDIYFVSRRDEDKENINLYKKRIENHEKYNNEIRLDIEDKIKKMYDKQNIFIDYIFE